MLFVNGISELSKIFRDCQWWQFVGFCPNPDLKRFVKLESSHWQYFQVAYVEKADVYKKIRIAYFPINDTYMMVEYKWRGKSENPCTLPAMQKTPSVKYVAP